MRDEGGSQTTNHESMCAKLWAMTRITRILWILVAAGTGVYAGLTLWLSFSAMFFPYTLDYGEGDVFWFTHKLALGQNIYTLPGGPPFDSANYPPVAMLLTASMHPLFGDTLTFGRWLNFAAALLVAALIVRFVRARTKKLPLALVMAGLFLGSTFLYHWIPLYRVDLIGLAFTFAGIFFVWRWEAGIKSFVQTEHVWGMLHLVLAALFFLLALYTKQSLLFAPLAAGLAILVRDRRAAIVYALALGGSGGVIFGLLELVTQGGWTFGIVTLNATVWTPSIFVPLVESFLSTYLILLGLAVWGWLHRVLGAGWGLKNVGVLEIYAVASLLAIALAGREGAWENYFLEPIAMTCVFAGFALGTVNFQNHWLKFALPLLLLIQLVLFGNEHDPQIALRLFDAVRAGNERVGVLVRNTLGTVIAEDMGLLWGNGKPVVYYSFPYSTLARAGRYDQKWETENLRAGNFPLVILNQATRQDVDAYRNFTRAFVSALDYGYAVTSQDARYVVYEPAPLQHLGPAANFADTFELVGWSLEPQELRAGQELNLTIVWHALQKPNTRYTTFAHLETADGTKLAQDDHEPMNASYPTTNWAQDEMVRDVYHLHLPQTINPGDTILRVGWYDTATQDRLGVNGDGDVLELKTFHVP